ncbi:MAG: hypothetical protein HYX78_11365 [Armatimonadetes bacterium]|nr:hypothetical protein [Armatimonadota bacterium]
MDPRENEEANSELVRLSETDYETEPGQPDLMGWPVADSAGDVFGKVDDLLVDVDTGEVPFASVCFMDRCTAVPLEVLYLDSANKRLVLPLEKEELSQAPEFTELSEDVSPYIEFWEKLMEQWEKEAAEEEEHTGS